jgi:hypothetical protein
VATAEGSRRPCWDTVRRGSVADTNLHNNFLGENVFKTLMIGVDIAMITTKIVAPYL